MQNHGTTQKQQKETTTDAADKPRTTQKHQQQKTRPTMEPTYRRPDAQTRGAFDLPESESGFEIMILIHCFI